MNISHSSESYPVPVQFTVKIISLSAAISLDGQKIICIWYDTLKVKLNFHTAFKKSIQIHKNVKLCWKNKYTECHA